jgi:nitric oxide reductase NorD protein
MPGEVRERRRHLVTALPSDIARSIDLVWRRAEEAFAGEDIDLWLLACRELATSGMPPAVTVAYVRNAALCAARNSFAAALALAPAARDLCRRAGAGVAIALIETGATLRLVNEGEFARWLSVVHLLADRAPAAIGSFLANSARLTGTLDGQALEAWVLGGLRAAGDDRDRLLRVFALLDPATAALEGLDGKAASFSDVERELKAFLKAVWNLAFPIRAAPTRGVEIPHRSSFGDGILRVPDRYLGVADDAAALVYRAALAHIAAHLEFGGARFRVGSLKPLQIVLVALIEDARVEALAAAARPGLWRLWRPLHTVAPEGGSATALMARLARALADPTYEDWHGWVAKGREMFDAAEGRRRDPAISREIGGLLGNDLGQMRVQFNFRTYAVEPAYRDDGSGLWEFDGESAVAEAELVAGVRVETAPDESPPTKPERHADEPEAAEPAGRARPAELEEGAGIPVARYPEWDYLVGRERADWATIVEYPAKPGRVSDIEAILDAKPHVTARIDALVDSAKVSRPHRLRHRAEGDRLDLDAVIAAVIDRRLGFIPDPNIYQRLERRFRDLAVLLLLDVSQSTSDIVRGAELCVLELERQAAAFLAHAMARLGDPFAIHTFCSDGRSDVRYSRVKDFDTGYGAAAKSRLAGLASGFSTRVGAAIRHAGQELGSRRSYRRLLLLVTDGQPSDVDVADQRYLVEDARRAVWHLLQAGIDVFCVGLDPRGDDYLVRIFGRRRVFQIDRIDQLPERLPSLYFRLLA